METIKNRLRFFCENKIYNRIISILLPALLILFSYCRVNKGLEITDTAYNYSNFLNLDGLDDMWFFSTFLANLLGKLFTFLPGGKTMLGLNIYTTAVKTAILLLAYFWFTGRVKLHRFSVFLALVMASGLSWCPTAVLYNYLTYLLLFLGVVFICEALSREDKRQADKLLLLAGALLGTNVFVRLPNLCEAALIVLVWFAGIIKKDSFKETVRKTFICIGGYLGAFIVWIAVACLTRGLSSYISGITQMLGGGGEAGGQYSPLGLIYTAFSGYIGIYYWALMPLFSVCVLLVVSSVVTHILDKTKNEKLAFILRLLHFAGAVVLAVLSVLYFRYTNLYTDFYYEYSSMYGINVIGILISIACLIFTVFDNTKNNLLRILSLAGLVVIFVTPLGSNNGTYSVLNNQYLVLPLTFNFIVAGKSKIKAIKPIRLYFALIIAVAFLHAFLFGLTFSFRDGGGDKLSGTVDNNPVLAHMKTVESNARYLTEVSTVWSEQCKDNSILVYGNAAGLAFYMNAKPAISTVWPSLSSFSLDKFEKEMSALVSRHESDKESLPVIVLGNDAVESITPLYEGKEAALGGTFGQGYIKKIEILYEFLKTYEYSEIYSCSTFKVLKPLGK